jgi:hypothetical protein
MRFLVTACGLQKIPTKSGNYCKDEVFAYLDDRFGEGLTFRFLMQLEGLLFPFAGEWERYRRARK